MKAENFEAAVSFYGKAIELNPSNAVYFCNRYWLSLALHTCGFGPSYTSGSCLLKIPFLKFCRLLVLLLFVVVLLLFFP